MPRGENKPSILLSKDENDQVFSLIGPKCQSLATAVVQLFTTEGPAHSEWKKKDTGVLCLIKDNGRRSYFFRIYCLYRKAMIWEHEVYMQIEYKSPRPYLHTFEAEEYMTAFNFANEDEARGLRNILIEKINLRKHRREERRQRSMLAARANANHGYNSRQNGLPAPPPAPAPAPAPPPAPVPAPAQTKSTFIPGYIIKSTSKKPKARKLTKADIGMPQDFKHVSHVGWDANKGFDVENLPAEEMRSFFTKAGISDTQLQDQETRDFIYDFIISNGGVDAIKQELDEAPAVKVPAPPVPSRSPAAHPPHPPHPPAPPSRAPPPPPARAVPPPPPPVARAPPSRPNHQVSAPPAAPPPPPPTSAPPPPPPPPAPAPPPPPAAPSPPAAPPPPPDTRAALMESIRSGTKTLRKVEESAKPAPVESSRSNLLSEIRQGVELRSVPTARPNSGGAEAANLAGAAGLAGALARALSERNRAIHSSDSDTDLSDATTSDGEWDD